MLKDIAVVIVNWNSNELVVELVRQLATFVEEIIVVDNNSDIPLNTELKNSKHCVVIQNNNNRGFASACNQGLSHVTKKWTLFLNPDVTVSHQNLLELLTFAQQNSLKAVSIVSDKDAYSKPIPSVLSLLTEFTVLNKIVPLTIFPTKTLIGGVLCIETDTLRKIGGWDERFFLWFEDSDLSKRLHDAKIPYGFCNTNIIHLGGHSVKKLTTTKQKQLFFQSMNLYARKHFSIFGQVIITALSLRYIRIKDLKKNSQKE